jgi:hypothetical protein
MQHCLRVKNKLKRFFQPSKIFQLLAVDDRNGKRKKAVYNLKAWYAGISPDGKK